MKDSDFDKAKSLVNEMELTLRVLRLVESGCYGSSLHVGGMSIEIEEISAYEAIRLKMEVLSKEMESIGLEYDK